MTKKSKRQTRALASLKLSSERDYLLPDEITKSSVKQMPLDMLYRTHVKIHKKSKETTSLLEKEHKLVADEIKKRGIIHPLWDELDSVYKS